LLVSAVTEAFQKSAGLFAVFGATNGAFWQWALEAEQRRKKSPERILISSFECLFLEKTYNFSVKQR
jgi:hypothetical protein